MAFNQKRNTLLQTDSKLNNLFQQELDAMTTGNNTVLNANDMIIKQRKQAR